MMPIDKIWRFIKRFKNEFQNSKKFLDFIEEIIEVEDETSLVRIVSIQIIIRLANQSDDRIELINEMLSINKSESRKKDKILY